jgi:hypothetical protein
MEIPGDTLLQSEVILQEFGFKRIFRWKIDKKNYMIQLCPKMKHVHILTANIVRTLGRSEPLCQECLGRYPRNIDSRLKDLYPYEHLMFKLFQVLDNDKFRPTVIWREIQSNLLGQTLFSHYLESKNKHIIRHDNPAELLDIKSKSPHGDLLDANYNYFNIIIKLDRENTQLRDDVKLLDEIIGEQGEMIDHFQQFLSNNVDIYSKFKEYHHGNIPMVDKFEEYHHVNNMDPIIDQFKGGNIILRLANNGKVLN